MVLEFKHKLEQLAGGSWYGATFRTGLFLIQTFLLLFILFAYLLICSYIYYDINFYYLFVTVFGGKVGKKNKESLLRPSEWSE